MGRERKREGERTKLEEVKSEIWEGRGCRSKSRVFPGGKGKEPQQLTGLFIKPGRQDGLL